MFSYTQKVSRDSDWVRDHQFYKIKSHGPYNAQGSDPPVLSDLPENDVIPPEIINSNDQNIMQPQNGNAVKTDHYRWLLISVVGVVKMMAIHSAV